MKQRSKHAKKQPVLSRLFWRGRKIKKVYLALSRSSNLVITFRNFKTSKNRRSKVKKQLIFEPRFLPVKQIAVSKQRRRKVKTAHRPQIAMSIGVILIGLTGTAYSAANLYQPVEVPQVPASSSAPSTAQPEQPAPLSLEPSIPLNVRIPSVGIDAPVGQVGVQSDGTMEKPKTNQAAAWYKLGPTPGQIGPSVIVGHVDSAKEGPAVFWRLSQVKPGEMVEIGLQNGVTARFKVDKVEQVPQSNFPTEQVYGNTDHAGIRLITCSGTYSGKSDRYSHNTVVFGTLIK